jgi:MFS family permease
MKQRPPRSAEFRRSWHVVLTAALGTGLGISGLLTYNSGLFVPELEKSIGLTRGTFGLAFFAATVALAVALPLVGRIIDHRGARAPALFGSSMLVIGFLLLATMVNSVATYFAIMIGIGLFAAGSTPVGYMRAVSAAFERDRGLALGFTQMGLGFAGALIPPLVTAAILSGGWTSGYFLLAGLAALGLLPAAIGLRGAAAAPLAAPTEQVALMRNRIFLLQMAAFALMALGFAGFLPHFVPLLRDAGLSPALAATYASIIGVAVIGSRLVIGWLSDRVHAPTVAAVVCLIAAGGCVTIALGGAAMAPIAALAFGCAMGAEADLVGFLTARYFGLAVYGRAYARQYAAFMLAAGASPAWIGMLYDQTGGYGMPLTIAALMLVGSAFLFTRLPRYTADAPHAAGAHSAPTEPNH